MAAAARIAVDGLEPNSARLRGLRDRLVEGVLDGIDDVSFNGARDPLRPGCSIASVSAIFPYDDRQQPE